MLVIKLKKIKNFTQYTSEVFYWLKYRIIKEGNETVTICDTFKFNAKVEKMIFEKDKKISKNTS